MVHSNNVRGKEELLIRPRCKVEEVVRGILWGGDTVYFPPRTQGAEESALDMYVGKVVTYFFYSTERRCGFCL